MHETDDSQVRRDRFGAPLITIAPATPDDLETLVALERACGLEALGHIFDPDEHPYPESEVRERWREELVDPEVVILLAHDPEPVGFVSIRPGLLQHLGVRPDRQRQGIARLLVDAALASPAGKSEPVRLWCLLENARALRFYANLGWTLTGREQTAEFPPYPTEVEMRWAEPRQTVTVDRGSVQAL